MRCIQIVWCDAISANHGAVGGTDRGLGFADPYKTSLIKKHNMSTLNSIFLPLSIALTGIRRNHAECLRRRVANRASLVRDIGAIQQA